MTLHAPIPHNEMDRLKTLSSFDLDYLKFQEHFKDMAKLAAQIAGTNISLVNLIDSFTQWSITNHGLNINQMAREDSVCQHTIISEDYFEINDLKSDNRFKDKFYVTSGPNVNYYLGVPLTTPNGTNIGALCVLDQEAKVVSEEKIGLLKIIADEIVSKLHTYKLVEDLTIKLKKATETQKKVAHDVRGPISGIIGLTQIITEQGYGNRIEEVLEFSSLITKSSQAILDLADDILCSDADLTDAEYNLSILKEKLSNLYAPQALNKGIRLDISISSRTSHIPFSKSKLLQIAGNLISNAIKFTPKGGIVAVELALNVCVTHNNLVITVTDSGKGLDADAINSILDGKMHSTKGTGGEQGYGFGLELVKYLVESMNGKLSIYSSPGCGAKFEVELPQAS